MAIKQLFPNGSRVSACGYPGTVVNFCPDDGIYTVDVDGKEPQLFGARFVTALFVSQPPLTTSEPITTTAHRMVTGDRGKEYGHPFDDFSRIAAMWSVLLKATVTPEQVAMCMIALKLGRLCHNPAHIDSFVDIAGYAECLDMIRQRREETK